MYQPANNPEGVELMYERGAVLISTASAPMYSGHRLYMRLSIKKPAHEAQVSIDGSAHFRLRLAMNK